MLWLRHKERIELASRNAMEMDVLPLWQIKCSLNW